jgi:hypothetical protein
MSTRSTIFLVFDRIHVFRDVNAGGSSTIPRWRRTYYIDIGRDSYNRAWKIWPPTLKRLY